EPGTAGLDQRRGVAESGGRAGQGGWDRLLHRRPLISAATLRQVERVLVNVNLTLPFVGVRVELPPGRDLLAGKVVAITAAAGTGIGSAAARRCLAEGAAVAISDRHARRLAEVRDELAAAHGGDRIWSAPCDVTEPGAVDALVAGAVAEFGRIDVFIN